MYVGDVHVTYASNDINVIEEALNLSLGGR